MNKIWVVNSSGGLDPRYGWFEIKEDCEKKCNELNKHCKGTNMWFKAHGIEKANG